MFPTGSMYDTTFPCQYIYIIIFDLYTKVMQGNFIETGIL